MWRVLLVVITILYPFMVYFGLQQFDVRFLVLLLIFVLGARLFSRQIKGAMLWLTLFFGVILSGWVLLTGNALGLKLYPVMVNASLLVLFGLSLFHPPTMVEKLARLQEPDLPPEGVRYTRRVTWVWCGFFIVNGSISLWTTLYGTDEQWALYNGLIAYGLIGALMAGEWCVRQLVMRKQHG